MARFDPPDAGFTLIEVMVALMLVAVSLSAIGHAVATTARGARTLEERVAMRETVRSLVAGLPSRAQLAAGSSSGEIAGQRWRIDVAPWGGGGVTDVAKSPWMPQAVAVQVRSASGATLRIETARLQRRPN